MPWFDFPTSWINLPTCLFPSLRAGADCRSPESGAFDDGGDGGEGRTAGGDEDDPYDAEEADEEEYEEAGHEDGGGSEDRAGPRGQQHQQQQHPHQQPQQQQPQQQLASQRSGGGGGRRQGREVGASRSVQVGRGGVLNVCHALLGQGLRVPPANVNTSLSHVHQVRLWQGMFEPNVRTT